MRPQLSVIIPAYNQQHLLRELLHSVLAQRGCRLEVVVVDDCSSDETVTLAKSMSEHVTVLTSESNQGPASNRLRGYKATSAEFVVFADQDDYYTDPDWFATACRVLSENEDLSFVAGEAEVQPVGSVGSARAILPPGERIAANDYLRGFQTYLPKPASTFTSVFRRSSLDAAGLSESTGVGDSVLYLRALLAGGAGFVHQPIGNYRQHAASMTSIGPPAHTIIHTLAEKKAISNVLAERGWQEAPEWFVAQCMVTLEYLVAVSPLSRMLPLSVIRWILGLPAPVRKKVALKVAFRMGRRMMRSVRHLAMSRSL